MSEITVRNLSVAFDGVQRVSNISFSVSEGEILAIVGESGAGKSLVVTSLLGLAPRAAGVTADELSIGGRELRSASDAQWRSVRGTAIGLISQDALSSLDPLRRIESEVAEVLEVHHTGDRTTRRERVVASLTAARMPDPGKRARQYPHQLSGGLRQRALIASAIAGDPNVLLADEPTTALDATVQRHILQLLRDLANEGRALVFVSHDLAAVAHIADRVLVMRAGAVVEHGSVQEILQNPQHPYTQELVAASMLATLPSEPRGDDVVLHAEHITVKFGDLTAVDDASLTLTRGNTVGIVGESGSGKSTLANVLMASLTPTSGKVSLNSQLWNPAPESSRRRARRQIQLVAQNSRASLNPRWTIRQTLAEALAVSGRAKKAADVDALLIEVGLPLDVAGRRPRQLSGGQAQRVAIARALAVEPDVLVLDEPLSALDVSVQARVIELLAKLQRQRELSMVFISHDLRVVAALAQEIIVMKDGAIVESGATAAVYQDPQHAFTRELLAASSLVPQSTDS